MIRRNYSIIVFLLLMIPLFSMFVLSSLIFLKANTPVQSLPFAVPIIGLTGLGLILLLVFVWREDDTP